MTAARWSRRLLVIGTAALVLGAADPLEGSIFVVAGAGVAMVAAHLGHLRARRQLDWGVLLELIGFAALWGLSAAGGIGERTGRSYWWALVLLPFPVGWLLSLSGAVRSLREK